MGEGKGRGGEGSTEAIDVIVLEFAPFVDCWYRLKIWTGVGMGSSDF